MQFLLVLYGMSIEFLWYVYDISKGCLCSFYGSSMIVLQDFYGGSVGFLWGSDEVSLYICDIWYMELYMGFLCGFETTSFRVIKGNELKANVDEFDILTCP